MELKDRELKDRKEKINREIEELFYKLIIVSKDDIGKSEEQEMKKIKPIKKNWYVSSLNKGKRREKKPKIIRDKLKDKIVNNIWTIFEIEEEKEDRNKEK